MLHRQQTLTANTDSCLQQDLTRCVLLWLKSRSHLEILLAKDIYRALRPEDCSDDSAAGAVGDERLGRGT